MSNKIELPWILSEGYGIVPKKLMKAKDLSSNSKLLLCYLLSYTGAGIDCFPSINKITEDLGISKRTVIRCISESIETKYIEKNQLQRGRGIGKQNIYKLLFMSDVNEHIASAKIARAKNDNASAKTDTMQVPNSTSNINNYNNNNYNNNNIHEKSLSRNKAIETNQETNIDKSLSNILIKLYLSLLKEKNIVIVLNTKDYIYNANQCQKYKQAGLADEKITNCMKKWFSEDLGNWCGYQLVGFWKNIGQLQTSKSNSEFQKKEPPKGMSGEELDRASRGY